MIGDKQFDEKRDKMAAIVESGLPLKGWGKRHTVFLAIILTNFIVWLDDAIFGTLTPYWGKAFELSTPQIASVSSAYLLGYFPFLFIAGILADRIGAKRLLVTCLLGCTIISASTIFVNDYSQIWWRNLIFGMFFGLLWAPCNRILAMWFPANERVRYTALWFSSTMAAFALAGPIGLTIAGIFTWKASFLTVTFLGLPILLFFAIAVKDRPEHDQKISKQELMFIKAGTPTSESQDDKFEWSHLKAALKNPSVYTMAIAAGLATTPNWLATTWGSTGLMNGFKVSPSTAGVIISLMYAIPMLLGFTNGWVVNKLCKGNTRAALAIGPAIGGISFILASFFVPNYIVYSLLVYGIAAVSNVYFWGTINVYWSGIARPEVIGTLNGLGSALQVAFGYELVSLSGGWVDSTATGAEAFSKVWLIGGIVFLATIVLIYLSKEVVLGKQQTSEQDKNVGNAM
ncbi:MFS transporter [Neobacillus bataviensis]|uniref:MFS transporter n=1 Tax=Neobacillus bataviensis TaxID=220685 RepID=UPI001CBC8A2C|nr:MFS transporter [Neobacillus bataviensis]